MLIKICSIKQLLAAREHLEHISTVATILCSSRKICPTQFGWLQDTLPLIFQDTENEHNPKSFSPEMASRVKAFVDSLSHISVLFICCDSGESRSAAIAAATYRYLHKDEMIVWRDPHFQPNRLVYRLMCQSYGIPLSKFQLSRRARINRKALSSAIKGEYR